MANMLENFGLDMLYENEGSFSGLIGFITKDAKLFQGYYGAPYIYKRAEDVEFWLSTRLICDKNLEVENFNTHCGNPCVWELRHSGIDITPKDDIKTKRLIMFSKNDSSGGSFPIELINADVLPSFMKDDIITAQMIALPLEINYYTNEDEYAEAQPEGKDGKKWHLAMGSMSALNFVYNHSPERYAPEKEYESDRFVEFTATVKKLYNGTFEIDGEKYDTFIRCVAETNYGELEFDHTLDMVPEDQRDNIKIGAIINGVCVLSGDVAIREYGEGVLKDFEHDLKLMRYTFVNGDPERIRCILTEDAVYESDHSDKIFSGAQEIIDKIKYVQENRGTEYSACFATIIETDDETLEYPVGTRCIALSSNEDGEIESLAFITVTEEGLISKIKISTDRRYHFKVDVPEKIKTPLDDCKIPDSVFELIIARAKYHEIIDFNTDEDSIINNIEDYYFLEQNAERMLDALNENPQPDVEVALENITGYLFAKAIEQEFNENYREEDPGLQLTASFNPEESFEGKITSTLSEEQHPMLEKAMVLGKQFYQDIRNYIVLNEIDESKFTDVFKKAAVVIQKLGKMYTDSCFDEWEEHRLDELCCEISNNEKYKGCVFETIGIYFAIKDGRIYEISDDASDSPRGGWFPEIVTGPKEDERKYLEEMMQRYEIDECFFNEIIEEYMEFDEDYVSEFFEEKKDKESLEIYHKIEKEIKDKHTPFESVDELVSALTRYELDGKLYYEWEGMYIPFYENICDTGEPAGSYDDFSTEEWIEILKDIDNHIVTVD